MWDRPTGVRGDRGGAWRKEGEEMSQSAYTHSHGHRTAWWWPEGGVGLGGGSLGGVLGRLGDICNSANNSKKK